jgi:hypothetical protein
MADLITVEQFETRTGRTLSASETAQVEALITDASALVVDIVGDADITDTWDVLSVGTVPGSIVPVIVSMVRRVLDNPNGYSQESIGSYSYSISGSVAGLFANKDEVRAIRKAAGSSGIASLNLDSHLPVRGHVVWLEGAL